MAKKKVLALHGYSSINTTGSWICSDASYVHRYSQNATIFSKRVSVFETEARKALYMH